jgi:2-C-methyl-D-erythritol 4-phosphate cytidylyltransferase
MKAGAIIPAAGSGTRMGGARKAFLEIGGKTLLQHCLDAFLSIDQINEIVVALPSAELGASPNAVQRSRVRLVAGGAHRADSVRAALNGLSPDIDLVVIHDAARPLVTARMIQAVLEHAARGESATVAVPVTDTLHRVSPEKRITDTPDRTQFWRAQTPQAFPRAVLEQAYARVPHASAVTDEAGLVARAGFPVRVIEGSPSNLKITTPDDVALAEATLAKRRT